ncbi:MAG: hypothetical protein ACLUNO_09975 [Oscillospiraceae bacterium]
MKQAIALAGGGTKGAYQVGAWKAMRSWASRLTSSRARPSARSRRR